MVILFTTNLFGAWIGHTNEADDSEVHEHANQYVRVSNTARVQNFFGELAAKHVVIDLILDLKQIHGVVRWDESLDASLFSSHKQVY